MWIRDPPLVWFCFGFYVSNYVHVYSLTIIKCVQEIECLRALKYNTTQFSSCIHTMKMCSIVYLLPANQHSISVELFLKRFLPFPSARSIGLNRYLWGNILLTCLLVLLHPHISVSALHIQLSSYWVIIVGPGFSISVTHTLAHHCVHTHIALCLWFVEQLCGWIIHYDFQHFVE